MFVLRELALQPVRAMGEDGILCIGFLAKHPHGQVTATFFCLLQVGDAMKRT